jgi:N-acetylmuramoyl-L-alanine amidase
MVNKQTLFNYFIGLYLTNMKKQAILIISTLILTASFPLISYASTEILFENQQSSSILEIVKNEKNKTRRERIVEIINRIDQTYGHLYENLVAGNKLTIFFDPAHGLLPNGRWQGGDATHRSSCTNLPEEYYSINISRKLYELLHKNKYIDIVTTDDFMSVLKGESDLYKDITFTTTVELAEKARAFIIISEHLNNISILFKADGRINLPGIHVTRNAYGWKVLQHIKDTYSGFLTLYNKLDASGFSMDYALKLKNRLVAKGLKPNGWNFGAVGDTRFCYFVDFPVSIIYESGFISNPEEEKNLRDPEYIDKIVGAQYDSFLETVKDTFGTDISGQTVIKSGDTDSDRIELLKLARLAIYFIKQGDSAKGIQLIREMEKKFPGASHHDSVSFFTGVKNGLINSSHYYAIAQNYKKQKKNKMARKYFWLARRAILRAPIFASLHERYRRELSSLTMPAPSPDQKIEFAPVLKSNYPYFAAKAPLQRNIIFPVEENQGLEKSIELALSPDAETLKKLVKSFSRAAYLTKKKPSANANRNKQAAGDNSAEKGNFNPGIYIVKLDKYLNVSRVKYVYNVILNPWIYQNHQYLKNSYFANDTKEKSL